MFAALVAETRQPHWYAAGDVADNVDGRFAVLATIVALASLRLEQGGQAGQATGAALTERFIEAMDAEHREMGLGDPTLGKTVRKLVGALSRRVGLWREVIAGGSEWREALIASLYRGTAPGEAALAHSEKALRRLWATLCRADDLELVEGRIG